MNLVEIVIVILLTQTSTQQRTDVKCHVGMRKPVSIGLALEALFCFSGGSGTDVCIPVPRIQRLCTATAHYCLTDKCFGLNY